MAPDARWVGNLSAVLCLRSNRLAIIVPSWGFSPALFDYRSHWHPSSSHKRRQLWGPDFWGVSHCRCEQTQTQQAQYNEFGKEAGLRTGHLRGLRQRSGRIVNSVVRGKVKVRPQASSEDEFFFSSSDTAQLELSGVFRIAIPLFMRSLWLYILLLPSSWPSICRLCRSPLECLSHPVLPSTCFELQWTAWHCSGVILSLMQSDYQLRAFNAEVTGFFTIALSPCSHSCPPYASPFIWG